MSQNEGWYPDPGGDPTLERYWDGQSWSTMTRLASGVAPTSPGWSPRGSFNPAAPTVRAGGDPGYVPPPPAPQRGGRAVIVTIGVIVAVLVVAILVGVFVLLPQLRATPSTIDTPTPSATQPSSGSASGSRSPTLNCSGGSGSIGQPGDVTTSGIRLSYPPTWTFRYDASQWSWLSDSARFGRAVDASQQTYLGVVAGGAAASNGFTGLEPTAASVERCLLTQGAWRGARSTQTASRADTIAGLPGWRRELTFTASNRTDVMQILVMDAGTPGQLAVAIAFWPQGDAAAQGEVAGVIGSIAKA